MQTFIPMEKRTVPRILRSQYLDHVEKRGIIPTLKVIGLGLLGALLLLAWTYPDSASTIFSTLWSMENNIIPKTIGVLTSFLASPMFFDHAKYLLLSLNKKTPHASI